MGESATKGDVDGRLSFLLRLPVVKAAQEAENAKSAEARNTLLDRLARFEGDGVARAKALGKAVSERQKEAAAALEVYNAAARAVSDAVGEDFRYSFERDREKLKLEQQLRDAGNGVVETTLLEAEREKMVAMGLHSGRATRVREGMTTRPDYEDTTSVQVLEHELRLKTAIEELRSLLVARDLSVDQIAQRVQSIRKTARIGHQAYWNPHAQLR
jgi:hypothetical protein